MRRPERPICATWCTEVHRTDDPLDLRDKEDRRFLLELAAIQGEEPPPELVPDGTVCPRTSYRFTLSEWFQVRVCRLPLSYSRRQVYDHAIRVALSERQRATAARDCGPG